MYGIIGVDKNCEVIDMGLGGTVVKTAGKAVVAGTKTLAKGTGKAVQGTANAFSNGVSKLVGNSKTKNDARVKKAESMMSRVVKEVDTTEKSNGMSY